MIDFVDTPPFLRIALRVAMATMHFHIAQTNLFLEEQFFYIQGIPGNNVAPMKNCPGWVQNRSIRSILGTGVYGYFRNLRILQTRVCQFH